MSPSTTLIPKIGVDLARKAPMGDVVDIGKKLVEKATQEPATALAVDIVNLIANKHPPVQAEEGFASLVLAARVLHKQLVDLHGKEIADQKLRESYDLADHYQVVDEG